MATLQQLSKVAEWFADESWDYNCALYACEDNWNSDLYIAVVQLQADEQKYSSNEILVKPFEVEMHVVKPSGLTKDSAEWNKYEARNLKSIINAEKQIIPKSYNARVETGLKELFHARKKGNSENWKQTLKFFKVGLRIEQEYAQKLLALRIRKLVAEKEIFAPTLNERSN